MRKKNSRGRVTLQKWRDGLDSSSLINIQRDVARAPVDSSDKSSLSMVVFRSLSYSRSATSAVVLSESSLPTSADEDSSLDREPSQLLVIARWPFPWTVRVLILALPMDCLWTVHVLNSNQYTDSPWEGPAC
ncbi:BnaCnng35620D [Brassica napus]|uniref:BnaCnng35620D protein n=1 Tax=Brassica napus TaxID=3708 RepID=A0A078J664_BRANA|nr:BnaCnng35620D [Brassica napus]